VRTNIEAERNESVTGHRYVFEALVDEHDIIVPDGDTRISRTL
jgi:hypothetical protein